MSNTLSKSSNPKLSNNKSTGALTPTKARPVASGAALADPKTGEELTPPAGIENSQAEANSVEAALVPQESAPVDPAAGPAKNTRAKANAPAKPKKSTKKAAEQPEKQSTSKNQPALQEDLTTDGNPEILELLGDANCRGDTEQVAEPAATQGSLPFKDNREAIWMKAVEAENEGDMDRSNFFYKMFASVVNNTQTPLAETSINGQTIRPSLLSNLLNNVPPQTSMPSFNTPHTGSATSVDAKQKGLSFKTGCSNQHGSVGFTPFFDKNLKELKAPIPLTIFNRKWQSDAMSHQALNQPKSEENAAEKGLCYYGFPYPSEWTLTLGAWTVAHREFHVCIRDVYGFKIFADWLLIHKAHCDRIHSNFCFMAAFRYDIQMRANTFAHHISIGDETFIPDISVFHQDIADQVYADVRKKNEIDFDDNPYVVGGLRNGWDPSTGAPKGRAANTFTSAPSPVAKGSSRNNFPQGRGGRSRGYFGGDRAFYNPAGGRTPGALGNSRGQRERGAGNQQALM
ncbi:hypothetical protein PTTG_08513 [Puccinia triticina 1-1 BBBD Race 1]|uniref:Uncharacterized protein n=1 Tax=Puccinia triticina (isolate 1-1 / race 1 (BBBD)) TaxID=630390 RepID=A0A180GSJ9_PUCT1|nr:hypothetical protein PTTG_08513 [Puccinia triticina 1-1 BBBD Race 1]